MFAHFTVLLFLLSRFSVASSGVRDLNNACYDPVTQRFVVSQFISANERLTACGVPLFVALPVVTSRNERIGGKKRVNLTGTFVALHRFLPDNIFHVIHDDLLPTFASVRDLEMKGDSRTAPRLLIVDRLPKGPHWMLYSTFGSFGSPLVLTELTKSLEEGEAICFEKLRVGRTHETNWYQHGLHSSGLPGPLLSRLTRNELDEFWKFLFTEEVLDIHAPLAKEGRSSKIVVLDRKRIRRLLNLDELVEFLAISGTEGGAEVVVLSLETHSVVEMARELTHTDVVIGMHGSLLVLASVMRRDSLLIEIFPYKVLPDKITPYRTMALYAGLNYVPIRVESRDRSVQFPDYPAHMGGIAGLSQKEQREILNIKEVGPQKCCHNPIWMFYINQDSIVDPVEISAWIEAYRWIFDESSVATENCEMITSFVGHSLSRLGFGTCVLDGGIPPSNAYGVVLASTVVEHVKLCCFGKCHWLFVTGA